MSNSALTEELHKNKWSNRIQSILLVLAMAAILSVVGYLIFGRWGFFGAIALTVLSTIFGETISTALVMRMYQAKQILPEHAPELTGIFAEISRRAELDPIPALYYIPSRMPNAFATGARKNNYAIAVTDGILRMMNPREIAGIIAHEVSHLMHHDTKVMGLADTMSRLVSAISRIGLFLIMIFGVTAIFSPDGISLGLILGGLIMFFAPTLMILLQLALSRSREFNADLGAAQLTGDPLGLASALRKLDRLSNNAGLWQRILNPGQKRAQPAFLRTHPATKERIAKLMEYVDQPRPIDQQIAPTGRRRAVLGGPRVRIRPKYHLGSGLWY